MRPLDGVRALGPQVTHVTFGAEGNGEWRSAPTAGTLSLPGATDWRLYDSELAPLASGEGDADGITAPEGALLLLYDPAGSTATVTRT